MKVISSLLTLAAAAVAEDQSRTLFALPTTTEQLPEMVRFCNDKPVEDYADACKVVGHSEEGVALVVAASKMNLPPHGIPLATEVTRVEADEQYWTIMMDHDEIVGFNETAQEDIVPELWIKSVTTSKANLGNGMKVLYSNKAFIVASFPAGIEVPLLLASPRNSAFAPLLMTGFAAKPSAGNPVLARLANQSATKPLNPLLVKMINDVDSGIAAKFIQDFSKPVTRNSYSQGAHDAADELLPMFKGFGFDTVLEPFDERFGPNVVGRMVSDKNPDEWVIVGAHYDSRARDASSQTELAPGANDNGSSIAMLLEIMRIVQATGAKFERSLMVVAFCAEEQGTIGSRALAIKMKENGDNVVAMLAADMIGYRDMSPAGRNVQIGLPNRYHDPDLTTLVQRTINRYMPEVEVCEYTGCCTDSIGFHEQGFSSSRFFEACGSLDDPFYHTSQDTFANLDVPGQLHTAIQGVLAAVLSIAEPIYNVDDDEEH